MRNSPDLIYQFADVAGLLNFVHGLSQWIYTQPDAEERDRLIDMLHAATPQATPETMTPLILVLPAESASWPIKPGAIDDAQAIPALPGYLQPLSWTNLALLLALEPMPAMPRRDDLVFVVQGVRDDLLAILDAIFELEHEHSEDMQLLLAPVEPDSLGGLRVRAASSVTRLERAKLRWTLSDETAIPSDKAVACLVKVSGLRRFYLLNKTITDPRLRLFYRHIFPPYVPVPPGLQLYVEWGYRYTLPPASFIMEAWQRDRLGLVLLPAPGTGEPLVVSSELKFRPVLQVSRDVRLADAAGHTTLTPIAAEPESRLLDVQVRLQKRPAGDVRENEQALRHRIQNDLWRLQRLLAHEREERSRRLYVYADDDPGDMTRLRSFILDNPLSILNEFGYFCGRFGERVYHLLLLPVEDGTSVVTPDRFPSPPEAGRVFRREPSWTATESGYEVYIPRDTELYPALTQGLEARDDLLRQALGLAADRTDRLLALLWPDVDGTLVNFHVPLDGNAGFAPLGGAAQTLNARVLTPEAVAAVSAQVFDGLREAIRPEHIPEDVQALRDRIAETYQAAWNDANQELERLLASGSQVEQLVDAVRERYADVEELQHKQLEDWHAFLQQVLALAENIEARAAHYDAELDAKHAALIDRLRQRVETNHIQRLRDKFEQVTRAVSDIASPQDRADIAAQLEALASEIRGSGSPDPAP